MLVEFSIFPLGQGESLSKFVAKAVEIVEKGGFNYRLTDMRTILEGDWDEIMGVIKKCHQALRQECPRVITEIRIDDQERPAEIGSKIRSVERILQRKVGKYYDEEPKIGGTD